MALWNEMAEMSSVFALDAAHLVDDADAADDARSTYVDAGSLGDITTDPAGHLFAAADQSVVAFSAPGAPTGVDLAVDATPLEELGADLLEIDVGPGSRIAGVRVFELRLPVGANVSLVVRDGASFVPKDSDVLRHGDQLLVVTPQAVRDDTEKRLQSVSRGGRLAGW